MPLRNYILWQRLSKKRISQSKESTFRNRKSLLMWETQYRMTLVSSKIIEKICSRRAKWIAYFCTKIVTLTKVSVNIFRIGKSTQRPLQKNVPQENGRTLVIIYFILLNFSDLFQSFSRRNKSIIQVKRHFFVKSRHFRWFFHNIFL